MNKTKVISIKSGEPYDIYIGRWNHKYRLPKSKWANPFKLGIDGNGDEVLKKYKEYILSNKILMDSLQELKGKTLACWCKTKENPDAKCHGDILVELLEDL